MRHSQRTMPPGAAWGALRCSKPAHLLARACMPALPCLALPCRNGRLEIRIENATLDVHKYNEVSPSPIAALLCCAALWWVPWSVASAAPLSRPCSPQLSSPPRSPTRWPSCLLPSSTHHTPRSCPALPQFMKGVATDYEELRQRQRKAMAEQMVLDEASLELFESQSHLLDADSLAALEDQLTALRSAASASSGEGGRGGMVGGRQRPASRGAEGARGFEGAAAHTIPAAERQQQQLRWKVLAGARGGGPGHGGNSRACIQADS